MKRLALVVMAVLLMLSAAMGQNVTSSVQGTVVDTTGSVVAGAECTLASTATGRVFTATSWTDGGFTFPNVPPGTYALKLGHQGMKTLTMNDIVVTANEVRSIGRIMLQVGGVQETVTVTAEVQSVQLNSAERSGTITGTQLNEIAIRGRDFFAFLGTIPGVVDLSDGGRETTDPLAANQTIYVLGNNIYSKNVTFDGVFGMDTGNNSGLHVQPNMDAIAEVKVLAGSYQAEYGRNAAAINVVSKTGTREFHGSGYDYYRHEDLNANNFFNNRSGIVKRPYRYRITGYSLGGPVYVPGKFNTDKQKLFFFFSQEMTGSKLDAGTYLSWMPTDLERNGNFSQSRDVNGSLITIKDPLTGQAFAGNIIPANRLNQYGKAILAILPSPNYTDPNPGNLYRYNYRVASNKPYVKRQEIVRIDYNVSPSLRVYYRLANSKDEYTLPYAGGANFPLADISYRQPGRSHLWSATKTFSPTLVNDVSIGLTRNDMRQDAVDKAKLARSRMANIPQWFSDKPGPELDPMYGPSVTFGGIPANPANMSNPRLPYANSNPVLSLTDNLSKVMGKHQFKAGLYYEYVRKAAQIGGDPYGTFSFTRNTSNPFDTGHSYANALAGIFNSYTEWNDQQQSKTRMWMLEWYLQDNWRLTRKLTLEVGLRMMHWTYGGERALKSHIFLPSEYDRLKMPAMYIPAFDASGKRVAQDPATKSFAPAPLIGLFVPGSGDPFVGIVEGGTHGVPKDINWFPPLGWAPRFGFAYDPFGKGKTAIRGGFGVFKDRNANSAVLGGALNPPNFYSVTASYGNLDTFANTAGALGPTSPAVFQGAYKQPTVMNFNLGIQQNVFGTVVDASYVGGLSRHISTGAKDLNAIPMYSRFDPANQDPTTGSPLSDNFLRPYRGYGSLNLGARGGFMASSNYNSLQVSANRRFSKGLQYGASFTFSKALGVVQESINPYFPTRSWDYGVLNWDRSKMFKANYVYQLPRLGTKLGAKPAKWVLDNWVLAGMITFMSGAPFTPGFNVSGGEPTNTGSALGARITVVGDPKLPKSEKSFSRNFNPDAFQATRGRSFGNAGKGLLRGPGRNNWDISLARRFPLKSESRYIQFRWETFNTFNHTQFSGLNSTARFDASGKQIDSTFGEFTAAVTPRVMQLSLRVVF